MKQEEKSQMSRQKIMESAMKEFGEKGYGLSSINTICKEGGISKGNLYHYFKDKDEVYLTCVKLCFDRLTQELQAEIHPQKEDIKGSLQQYFDVRMAFFQKNPLYRKVFCDAVIAPPEELAEKIGEIRQEFDQINISILTELIRAEKLRDDMTLEEAVNTFRIFQDFVSARYRSQYKDQAQPDQQYETICKRAVSILLYGVIDRR